MSPADLLEGHVKSISPPDFFVRLNALVEKPGVSAADIGELISQDPVMAARLLRIANSPVFGFPGRIDSIARSITMIGTRGLRDLVLASSAVSAFSQIEVAHIDMREFWRHSLMTGLLSRQLGKRARLPYIEPLFVAGLLHDIGLLLIGHYFPDVPGRAEVCLDHSEASLPLEEQILGVSHADLARAILAEWNLPDSILLPVACHHDAREAGDYMRYAAIVQIADMASSGESDSIDDDLWLVAGISPHDLQALYDSVIEQVDGVFPVFFARAA